MLGNWLTVLGGLSSNVITFLILAPQLISARNTGMVLLGVSIVIVQLICNVSFGKKFIMAIQEIKDRYVS